MEGSPGGSGPWESDTSKFKSWLGHSVSAGPGTPPSWPGTSLVLKLQILHPGNPESQANYPFALLSLSFHICMDSGNTYFAKVVRELMQRKHINHSTSRHTPGQTLECFVNIHSCHTCHNPGDSVLPSPILQRRKLGSEGSGLPEVTQLIGAFTEI